MYWARIIRPGAPPCVPQRSTVLVPLCSRSQLVSGPEVVSLETLGLYANKIDDEGFKALAAALKEGAAPSLKARDATLATRPSPA